MEQMHASSAQETERAIELIPVAAEAGRGGSAPGPRGAENAAVERAAH